jgi:hypothetical protein
VTRHAPAEPVSARVPHPWVRGGIKVATLTLPRGETRDRYRQEFLADLHLVPRTGHATYTLGVLINAWSLRAAVTGEGQAMKEATVRKPQKPLSCRLNWKHVWKTYSCEDGSRYRRCVRCGQYHSGIGYPGSGSGVPVG